MQQQLMKSNLFLIKRIDHPKIIYSPLCGSKPVQLISLSCRTQDKIFWEISQVSVQNILVTNILQIHFICVLTLFFFFIGHETLVMHVCLHIFKVAFSMYRNHNCWKHVLCSWMLHFDSVAQDSCHDVCKVESGSAVNDSSHWGVFYNSFNVAFKSVLSEVHVCCFIYSKPSSDTITPVTWTLNDCGLLPLAAGMNYETILENSTNAHYKSDSLSHFY